MTLTANNSANSRPDRPKPWRRVRELVCVRSMTLSLRLKALLAIAVLAAYLIALGVIVSHERTKLRGVVEEAKASGLVARAVDKTGAKGVTVAPPAK